MRRIALILVTLGAGALVLFGLGAGEDQERYEVRAIFDSGGFLVPDEEVRIAGARVGTISEVDVTGADEAAREDGSTEPGSAVVVLDIENPAFQDFRQDASCIVRPQSLLGERFVECEPTQPRAAGSDIPPELEEIPDGEPGEGQFLLPIERNRKAVDLDLLNNILEEPYPDRFRLILNEFGAGLATRGADLEEVIQRADPALAETNEVLAILADQRRQLEQLAEDGDRVLEPLARERDRISGFLRNATVAAEATAERRSELEENFQKLPGFLRELRLTMPELTRFTDESTPTLAALGDAAPFITRATVALGPFAEAGTRALTSLGDATETAGPDIAASEPIITDIRELSEATEPAARDLSALLASTRERDGYDYITRLIYNGVGIGNGYDSFGHFLRAFLPLNNCVEYVIIPDPGIACRGVFSGASDSSRAAAYERDAERVAARTIAKHERDEQAEAEADAAGETEETSEPSEADETEDSRDTEKTPEAGSQEALLDFLLGAAEEDSP